MAVSLALLASLHLLLDIRMTSTASAVDTAASSFAVGPPQDDESSETLSLWKGKWSKNQIGWHKNDIHYILKQHGNKIIPRWSSVENDASCTADGKDNADTWDTARIFVPLCGKCLDMAFLSRHPGVSEVVGIDGISKALQEFAEENTDLRVKKLASEDDKVSNSMEQWKGESISLLREDLFQLDDSITNGKFDAIWDRASLVAIDPTKRKEYVEIMGGLIKPGGKILLVTLDKREGDEEGRNSGPPFSVDEAEVRSLYESTDWVESVTLVEEYDDFVQDRDGVPRWEKKGITAVYELCFLITAKGD